MLIVACADRAQHDLIALAVRGFLNSLHKFGMEGVPHVHGHTEVPRAM